MSCMYIDVRWGPVLGKTSVHCRICLRLCIVYMFLLLVPTEAQGHADGEPRLARRPMLAGGGASMAGGGAGARSRVIPFYGRASSAFMHPQTRRRSTEGVYGRWGGISTYMYAGQGMAMGWHEGD